jgi:hypothetical protein
MDIRNSHQRSCPVGVFLHLGLSVELTGGYSGGRKQERITRGKVLPQMLSTQYFFLDKKMNLKPMPSQPKALRAAMQEVVVCGHPRYFIQLERISNYTNMTEKIKAVGEVTSTHRFGTH